MTIRTLFYYSLLLMPTVSFSLSAKQLNLLMWEDSLSTRVINQWQKETGIAINITHFDSNDDRDILLSGNQNLPFDILVLDNISTNVFAELGKLAQISKIKNRKHHDTFWLETCGEFGMPYFWGSVGVVYRIDKVKSPPKTWAEFIRPPPELSGHIGLLNDTTDSFLPFLLSRGISPNTDNAVALKQTYQAMRRFNRHVLTYQYPLTFINQASNAQQLYLAMAYSGDQHLLNQQHGKDIWRFTTLSQQPQLWVDCLTINKKSAKQAIAKQFISYVSSPNMSATNATEIKAATTNRSARKLLPGWYLNDALLSAETENILVSQMEQVLSAENISLRAKILSQLLIDHETQY